MIEFIKYKSASSIIGKTKGFWSRDDWDFIPVDDVFYAGGIEELDTDFKITKPRQVRFAIYKHEKGLNFQIWTKSSISTGTKSFILLDKEINKITFGQSELMTESMGAVGKGLIGGALFGPAGLLLGALKGHGDTTKNNTTILVTIEFDKNNSKKILAVEVGPKCKTIFITFLQHNYGNILVNKDKEKPSTQNETDISLEIKKFHDLKESGIISQEEFDIKKKELLSK